jgi:hypothetical protein
MLISGDDSIGSLLFQYASNSLLGFSPINMKLRHRSIEHGFLFKNWRLFRCILEQDFYIAKWKLC